MYKVFLGLLLFLVGCAHLAPMPVNKTPTYDERLNEATEICMRPVGETENSARFFKAYRLYDKLLLTNRTPRLYYAIFECKLHWGEYYQAGVTLKKILERWPDLVRPHFLKLRLMLANKHDYRRPPWEKVEVYLAKLVEKYPGEAIDIVKELETQIAEHRGHQRRQRELAREIDKRKMDLDRHEMLEEYYGAKGVADCQNDIDKYERKGYKQVMWTLEKGDDGEMICEIWGIPPGKK